MRFSVAFLIFAIGCEQAPVIPSLHEDEDATATADDALSFDDAEAFDDAQAIADADAPDAIEDAALDAGIDGGRMRDGGRRDGGPRRDAGLIDAGDAGAPARVP